jgi:hypothetical protein
MPVLIPTPSSSGVRELGVTTLAPAEVKFEVEAEGCTIGSSE